MASLKVNGVLPFIAVCIVVLTAITAYVTSGDESNVRVVDSEDEIQIRAPMMADADTATDTITSLAGLVDGLKSDVANVSQENQALRHEKVAIEKKAEEDLKKLESLVATQFERSNDSSREIVELLTAQLSKMKSEVANLKTEIAIERGKTPVIEPSSKKPSGLTSLTQIKFDPSEVEIVAGLGIDGLDSGSVISGDKLVDYIWINPLDRDLPSTEIPAADAVGTFGLIEASNRLPTANDFVVNEDELTRVAELSLADNDEVTDQNIGPVFTLPDLSIMGGATALTSLVGRVYADDEITDPWPFKVMIRKENLTANYQDLPTEIDGMLFEGYATGDWTLSCVRGYVTVGSFVFDDGTTVRAFANSNGNRPSVARTNKNSIGYITDPFGNPCVLGKRVTNAPQYLAGRTLAAAATGYANALNASNRISNTSFGSDGTVNTATQVINASGAFAAREAYAEAFEEGAKWIRERQAQNFDAIYVVPGSPVVINLQSEIWLDRTESSRKISYTTDAELYNETID